VVDLPPEEDTELCLPAMKAGLNFIRLATPPPTTSACRRCSRTPPVLSITFSITGINRQCGGGFRRGRRSRRPHQAAYQIAGLCRFRHPHSGRGARDRRKGQTAPVVGTAWSMP